MRQKVGVVGLGYIGLPLLAVLADVDYEVVGMDMSQEKVSALQQKFIADIYEPGLNELLQRNKGKIEFTASYEYLTQQCSALIITVGTPLKDKGVPNIDGINHLTIALGKHLKKGHLLILRSTVYPGVTRQVALELEKTSGLKAGSDFHIAFSPERTIEGLAIHELSSLPKIVAGINSESTDQAASILKKLGGKVIKVSSLEVAEMCKLIDNAYRAMNIAFANEIGSICEKIGIDAYEVASAATNSYERTQLYQAGLGGGGPCLSKDPQILKYYAQKNGIKTEIIDAFIAKNKKSTLRIAAVVSQFIQANEIKKPRISLVGLAFKGFPETDDIRGSPAIDIQAALRRELGNIQFTYYDTIVKIFLNKPVSQSLEECIRDSNVVMFLTNHPALMNINVSDILANSSRPLLIIDCWHNVLNLEKIEVKEVKFYRIGDGRL